MEEITTQEGNALLDLVQRVGEELRPHFDSAFIICTYRGEEGTMFQLKEVGNSFAIRESIRCYLAGKLEAESE